MKLEQADLGVSALGPATIASPLAGPGVTFVSDSARVLLSIEMEAGDAPSTLGFEKAGPRSHLFFSPEKTRAAIVTCGGLCPGINNVIRSLVLELHHKYRAKEIVGFRFGFEGITPGGASPLRLSLDEVSAIHTRGGTILGTSRGAQDASTMVDTLERFGIDILFCIGGDGTLRGAHAIAEEVKARGATLAVVGIPKSIDNDVAFVDKTFGLDTAVEIARGAIDAAHTEATSARNGVGIVKLMGRDSGFIAASATLASLDVNVCLVPEVPFRLEGDGGLLAHLEARLAERGHAVLVVAEGCAAAFAAEGTERDASGNTRYASEGADVGRKLRDAVTQHFRERAAHADVKYIDPSYLVRSAPANASDSIFCDALARSAVHAGLAGKTDLVVGRWHRAFTHVPLAVATSERKRIDAGGPLWASVLAGTGQPSFA